MHRGSLTGVSDHESHENPYRTMHTQTIIEALFVSVWCPWVKKVLLPHVEFSLFDGWIFY